jgi:hypothetical protein
MSEHIFDRLREVCIACGRTRKQLVEEETPCEGIMTYREWLHGTTWVREPVIPKRP